MRRHLLGLAAIGTFLLTTAPLYAQGTLLVQKETKSGKSVNHQTQMDKDHIRVETGDDTVFIFDGSKQIARTIDVPKKTYTEMTKKEVEGMRGQMDAAMAQLQALPPEQRAMMEAMMRGRGGAMPGMPTAAAAPKVEYKRTGSDKVGQWNCTKYEGTTGGQKTSEVCTVDPKDLGLTPADFEMARQLSDFIKAMLPQAADAAVMNGTANDQGYAGVPVRRTTYRNGAVDSETEIVEVKKQAFPASTFEVPSGFKKVTR